ncbi:RND transporter [Oxalicibacterium flavum]|uniref:RND transporter n=1 Tax=Oxalicibacterium flavum TaxID=179467 RepID=A0A8J2UKD5_9BURK|nr:efflux transporter outer membrane subunit [Oxalicibacterium flavum]GGC02686.1 RND transporter [Oxalicibacterium flavum]
MTLARFPLSRSRLPSALLMALLLGGCAIGPDYVAPSMELPTAFRHQDGWQATASLAEQPAPGAWWDIYRDADLDRLLREVEQNNASLAEAEARWRQAIALIGSARAAGLPTVGAGVSRSRTGGNTTTTRNVYGAELDIAWVPDLWGRVARQREAAQADAQAAQALLDAARLALQLEAAQGYVRVRALDQHAALMARALTAYERSLQLTRRQYEAGFVARADVIQAETQLQSLRTQVSAVQRQRTLEEHALATLAGSTPAQWRLTPNDLPLPDAPAVPAALPSALLIQRPDIAAAERQVASANARIGVAQSAWLPDLTLGATGTLQAGGWQALWDAPTRVWSAGPALAATLFDGGTRRSVLDQTRAQYDERAAAWRSAVLLGVRETEDALASLQSLSEQDAQQQELVRLASENEQVVTYRYEAGEITFLEVATAQNLALQSRRNALDVQAELLTASMRLVGALGGGWQMPDS